MLSAKIPYIMLKLRVFIFVHSAEVLCLQGDHVSLLESEGRGNNRVLEYSFADCSKSAPLFFCLSKNILGLSENRLIVVYSQIDLN